MKKFRMMVFGLVTVLGISMVAGCGGNSGTVSASGSTALLPLLKQAQEQFQKQNANVTVTVSGGGSLTGQSQVAAGAVDIGNSDVAVDDSLKDKGLVETKLVVEPFVFIVNPDVTVDNLSQQQIVGIFSGKITNWKEVGGKDEKIAIIHRAPSSGSRVTIKQIVMKDADFATSAAIQDSNGAVRSAIAGNPGAIGYVDAAYIDQTVKVLGYNGVKYAPEKVEDGSYPVYNYGRMFTKGQPTGAVKAFIDYVTGKEFQAGYVENNKFIPLSKMKQ